MAAEGSARKTGERCVVGRKKKKKNKSLEKDIETGRVFSEVPPYEDPCGERKTENNLSACTVCKGSFCF